MRINWTHLIAFLVAIAYIVSTIFYHNPELDTWFGIIALAYWFIVDHKEPRGQAYNTDKEGN